MSCDVGEVTESLENVLAKALLPKGALLDWSAPGLNNSDINIYLL